MMALLLVFALSFVACEEPTPEPEPQPQPEALTFEIEVAAVSKTDATFNITPSNDEAKYLVVVSDAKVVESSESNAALILKIFSDLKAYVESTGGNYAEYIAEKAKSGKLENHKIENLTPGTSYYILVFGIDTENEDTTTSELHMRKFATEATVQSNCTFELKYNVNLTTVALSVKPSDNSQLWHLINMPVEEYQTYTSADGEYGWTKEKYFQEYLNTELATLKDQGLTAEEIGVKLFHEGARTLNISGLQPKTKYVSFVAAVDYSDGNAYVASALKEIRYNSGEAAENDLTFDIDVFNVGHYSADVRITPSNLDANYYYCVGYIDSSKKSMKPVELAQAAVTEYIYYWDENNELKRKDPVKGVVDLTGENKLELNIAETEYYIVAFSFEPNPTYGQVNEETGEYDINPGTITTAPVYVSFVTEEQGDPMNVEFEFSASEIGPYGFTFEVKPSDPTIYYQPGIAVANGFNPQTAMGQYNSLLAQLVQMTMTGQSPSLTFWEALEQKLTAYYRNGEGKYRVENLQPETEYLAYVLVIDAHKREFVRCVYSDVIAKTEAVGGVNPSAKVLGTYNGDVEAGAVFGDAELTAGRAILAVEIENFNGASAVFCALSADAYEDVASLTDRYIISEFRGYWNQLRSLDVPYDFMVAAWDVDQTILAYAKDANGNEGQVARVAVKPTGVGDDIEELKGYVEAVNNAMAKPAKSMVFSDKSLEPQLECIWSEAVGAPRAAKVTYHEVEPLTAPKSDVMSISYVRSFFI